ncbi:uncharacterized protein [Ptychodera flava]|uniref:uncharacterized protein n=1 Tax=Ptychodera flava TaxID=63121 RepID=UPI00396A69B9
MAIDSTKQNIKNIIVNSTLILVIFTVVHPEGNAYVRASDQSYKGQTNKTEEASTSFAVYAAPDQAKKKKNLDSHPDETPYANVTGPSTQHEPPFLTNGTDGASPYANFKEMNGSKKEPDTAYADVQMAKPEKGKPPAGGKGKKPQRKGKKATAYQGDRPYDDVPDETAKNVKPLSSSQENPYEVAAMTVQKPKPQDANVEGLTYADLDFKGGPKTKTKPKPPVKPTEDDAVAYAAVDFSKSQIK